MNQSHTDNLKSLLRGELAAAETYNQALEKLGDAPAASELRRIHKDHRQAADTLRREVRQLGGNPPKGSGAWGTFAKAVEGTAKLFGRDAALKALKEGEEHGIADYERALRDHSVPPSCEDVIQNHLLPRTRAHIPVLDRLIAGMVERIEAAEAQALIHSDPSAMLICAYDSDEQCQEHRLPGAFPLSDFEAIEDTVDRDRKLIFYCA